MDVRVPFPAQRQKWPMNEADEGSRRTTKREKAYSTLPIFLTAAISRALSSATNLENSGASR